MSEEDESREHEATQKRLDEARQRGEVVRSADLTAAAAYGGLFAAAIGGKAMLAASGSALARMLEGAGAGLGAAASISAGVGGAIWPLLPFLAGPAIAVLAALFAQRAFVFAPGKLQPNLQRIDPLANARQKFGRAGLFEFAKSAVKLGVIAVLLGRFLSDRLPDMMRTGGQEPGLVAAAIGQMVTDFLLLLFLVGIVIGGIDYLWQRFEHLRRNRMTRQELIEELKQAEGDPQVKGQRRRRAEEIAMNRMIADVATADVVIVNPTHYAVALRWNRASGRAPLCVAKGVDEVAARIRAAAATAGVPIHSDPATARAIHASVEIGQEIRLAQYAAVAAAIRFAERMRQRARERGRR